MKTKICKDCKIEKLVENFSIQIDNNRQMCSVWYSSYCKDCCNIRRKKYDLKIKLKVINYYSSGTNSCKCCNENKIEFLTIDHINNGRGNPADRSDRMGLPFYRKLIKLNFPEGFQVLCYNCNLTKGFLGICPHNTKYKEEEEIYNLYT